MLPSQSACDTAHSALLPEESIATTLSSLTLWTRFSMAGRVGN